MPQPAVEPTPLATPQAVARAITEKVCSCPPEHRQVALVVRFSRELPLRPASCRVLTLAWGADPLLRSEEILVLTPLDEVYVDGPPRVARRMLARARYRARSR